MGTRLRWVSGVLAVTLVAAVATATASTKAGPTAVSGTAADIAYASAQIAKYKAIPSFTFRGPKFNAAKAKGKLIFNIPIASYIQYIDQTDQLMKTVAESMGVKFVEFPNQGQPSQWVAGINQAIARKADLIILQGAPPPQLLGPQLAAAKKAGIPVLLTHIVDPTEAVPAGVTASVPGPFQAAARLEADYVIKDTKGKANVLIIVSDEVLPTAGIKKAMLDEFAKHCGSGCKTKIVNVPVVDWATKLQSETQAALTADPKINYVIPIYDSMAGLVAPGILASGKKGKVKIATYNGTPFVLKMIQDDNIVTAEVGENLDWLAHAFMDQAFRMLTGTKTVANERTPLRVFDDSNVIQTGKPPVFQTGYGSAYVDGYNKIWGLSK